MPVKIDGVKSGSPCAARGIRPGDNLISINGNQINDVFDYQFYSTEPVLRTVFQKHDGKYYGYKLVKPQYEETGLEFASYLMDEQKSCRNHCIFCFVDQMPPGMRKSLYFKDDDARLSFLFGNYITLTNLTSEEVDRIIKMKITPVNVSVHTTNPALRCKMMNNRFAGERLHYLQRLVEGGITVNCQLVLCPGINDGEELKRSLHDLSSFYPGVQSVACVPVGVTKYREGLFPLETYSRESARSVIACIETFSGQFEKEHGTRFVYASDEFYLRAETKLPVVREYGDFLQLENGVGVLRLLEEQFTDCLNRRKADDKKRAFSLATGTDAAPYLQKLIDAAGEKWHNLEGKVFAVRNTFFGDTITVAGLITARDLIDQLKGRVRGTVLLLPDCMLRHGEDCFLDDLTVKDVEEALDIPVKIVGTDGDALLDAILDVSNM